jgi:hypothetical protein
MIERALRGLPALIPASIAAHPADTLIGDVAQLGERLVCNQEVEGSIPFVSILTLYLVRTYNRETAFQKTRRSPDWVSAKTGDQGRNFSYFNRLRLVGIRAITRRSCERRNRCTLLWADENRGRLPKTAPWHYVDVPLDESRYDSKFSGDVSSKGCVVDKINAFRLTVKDPAKPLADRRFALRFLVHCIEDLHMPMHVGDDSDKGGN